MDALRALPTPALAGIAVVLGLVCVWSLLRGRGGPPPGKLRPQGTFEHEDPANTDAMAERRRDFSRIAASKRDIWVFTDESRRPGTALPVELPESGADPTQAGKIATQKLKFWLQSELGKIDGAIDLGMTSQWPLVDRLVYFISASPGFDFVMRHKVQPMIMQAKYLVAVSKSGQVRAAWYAFVTDRPTPGATSGPWVVKLVTEDLSADREDRTHTTSNYTATATRETDMEKLIERHVPLIMKGVDADDWNPFLRA